MYKNIEKGLKDKHGDTIDVDERMKEITISYLKRLDEKKNQIESLET